MYGEFLKAFSVGGEGEDIHFFFSLTGSVASANKKRRLLTSWPTTTLLLSMRTRSCYTTILARTSSTTVTYGRS